MSRTNSLQNTASPLLCGYRLAAQSLPLEQQAHNLVSAMKFWDTLVNDHYEQVSYHREQMEELSRLYRRARRAWVELRRAQGKPANADFPTWVYDYYTYP